MPKADFEGAKERFPSHRMAEPEWVAFFNTPAGFYAMGRIIADIYDEVKAEEDRENGVRQMGRRPNRPAVPLSEVYATVFPRPYSMDPFSVSMAKLLEGRSQRAFCRRVPIHQTTLSRFLTGSRTPDLDMLERLAAAAKVKPSYFVEWRAMYVGQLITTVLLDHPNVGIRAVNTLHSGRREWDTNRGLESASV